MPRPRLGISHSLQNIKEHLAQTLQSDSDLLPLPDEKYPRRVEQRKPDRGYYVALGVVLSVWMITPLSCVYLAWYVLLGGGVGGHAGLTGTLFAGYALTEVVFALYMHYLIRFVQQPSPPATLPLEMRNALFIRILKDGLTFPTPQPPRPQLDVPVTDPEYVRKLRIYNEYASGAISARQYHHAIDAEYEEGLGIYGEKRRVGKMVAAERNVIDAFVEDQPGEREARLRAEVEDGWVVGKDDDAEDLLVGPDGQVQRLHEWDKRAIEFRERLRTWFNHAPWASIKKQNVLIWLSWSCFGQPLEDSLANPKHVAFLDETLVLLEARTGWTFSEGFDRNIPVIRLTLDPVNAKGRPLLLYALSNSINWALRELWYPSHGMELYTEGGIDYLVRIPKGWTPEIGRTRANAMPVVYLHGLGFGLLQNHLLIKHLVKSLPTHPLVVPLAHHTSQSFFHPRHLRPWTRGEVVHAIKVICTKWGFWEEPQTGMGQRPESIGGVSLLSHSNGSVHHGWLLKDCPSLARRSCFVDPVVFCLWEGDVCHSFCYRQPKNALELLLYYFIASEVGIANYIQRNFDWADNTLFFDEIPNVTDPEKTAIFLGGKDIIVDAARTRRYLERHGMSSGLHWDANAGHGDGLSGESRDRVVMFVGTGNTRGWQGWLSRGRRSHSLGKDDWPGVKQVRSGSSSSSTTAVEIEGFPSSTGRRRRVTVSMATSLAGVDERPEGDEFPWLQRSGRRPSGGDGDDSDRTCVEERKKSE